MNDVIDDFRYATWELEEMVRAVEVPNPFLLRMFFGQTADITGKTIEFDIVEGGRRLAPFVSPLVAGQPVRSRGSKTMQFTPAYIKPLSTKRPADAFKRLPGESYGGRLSPRQRMDRHIAECIMEHGEMIENRLEWMAAKALCDGGYTVSGENYASVSLEFGRNANLVNTLSEGVEWDDANGDPIGDIEDMALDIRKYSYGAVADTIIMDGLAWGLFRAKMSGNNLFSTQLRHGASTLDVGPRSEIDGQLVGNLSGRFDVYVYDGQYEDNDGVATPYLPSYTCLVVSRTGIMGKQYFGAIEDLEAGLVPMKHFVKTWPEKDPSGLAILSQSAPLVAPKRPNACGKIVVNTV